MAAGGDGNQGEFMGLQTNRGSTPRPRRNAMYWAGWVLSVLPMPLFALSAFMKLTKGEEAVKGIAKFGWQESSLLPLGIVELACVVVYLIPQTAVLGAILLTGYLGGAVATHARLGESFSMPIIIGVVLWLGLFLRDARVRALIPLRS
jgi:hypothetical protein